MFLHTFRLLFLRTRLLATVAILLVAANLLLPCLLDAAPAPGADSLQLYLTYASALTRFLLGLFALWSSCAALPQEAELHTLPLLLTRPVPRLRIWLGKWLAVVVAAALLLALSAASAAVAGARIHHRAGTPSPLLPLAYAPIAPIPPDTTAAVDAILARHRARNGLPPEAPLPPVVVKNARDLALADAFTLTPHAPLSLEFPPLPRTPYSARDSLLLTYRCDPLAPGAYPFLANATLSIPPAEPATLLADAPAGTPHTLAFPPAPETASRPASPAAPPTLTFTLLPPAAPDTPAISYGFDPADGLALRVPASPFALNLAKYLLAILARLALLAAIGTTLGTLFSLPVAAFLSLALVTLLQCSALLNDASRADRDTFLAALAETTDRPADAPPPDAPSAHDHAHGPSHTLPRPVALAIYATYRGTAILLHPFLADDTAALFLSATHIPPKPLLRTLLSNLLLAPAVLALLSTFALRRREWEPPA